MGVFLIIWGLLTGLIGLVFILDPQRAKNRSTALLNIKNYKPLGAAAIVISVLFFLASASEGVKMPLFVVIVGIISLLKGVFYAFAKQDKVKFVINWWVSLPIDTYRIWGVIALIVGILLIIAGA